VEFLSRHLEPRAKEMLDLFPVVVLEGSRQVGKSTLASQLSPDRKQISLDDLTVLAQARQDPQGFLRQLPRPVTIDEVQRVPELLLAIKEIVDKDRKPGSFLLTGSAHLSTLKKVRESLAGRVGLVRVRPLTAAELAGKADWNPLATLDACKEVADLLKAFPARSPFPNMGERILAGGFPEPAHQLKTQQRPLWFEQYRMSTMERDVPELVHVADVPAFLRFTMLCAATTAQFLNLTRIARDVGISVDTSRRWLGVLEATCLVERLTPYWKSTRSRLVRTPKLHVCDAGLAAHLMNLSDWKSAEARGADGHLLETWVHAQVRAFAAALPGHTEVHYFRVQQGPEVDLVLFRDGRLIPIEVKRTATLRPEDALGIRAFRTIAGQEAPFGIILYGGEQAVPCGEGIAAVPLVGFLEGPQG
jgi:predicted AAA+ superfamily ATPase